MRIKPLPPLNSLVAFEAAARYLSFTQAAEELNVTQGAISRQIKHLEDYLGRALFIRSKRSLVLTPTGNEYYQSIEPALLSISATTGNIIQWKGDQQVTVFISNAMASFWLFPRFNEFQAANPQVDLRILAVDSIRGVRNSEFDIALFYSRTPPQEFDATPLFSETVFPVCSPSYLQKHPEISDPHQLSNGTLLSLDINEDWVTWADWFKQSNITPAVGTGRKLNINNYLLVIQAALNGQGLALGWSNLVDDYLASGLLVCPIDLTMKTQSQFYMLQPPQVSRPKKGVECFRKWLISIIEETQPKANT